MYIPAPFRETRIDRLHEIIRRYPFATMITTGSNAEPFASHLPLLLESSGEFPKGLLIGHLAKVNQQVDQFGGAPTGLAIFHGPHAYVSPRWYATAPAVPTWNYVAVHAYGPIRVVDDPIRVRTILEQTVRAVEPEAGGWSIESLPEPYLSSMSAGIVAFEMPIERLEGKYKLSQNRQENDRVGVIQALAMGTEDERQVADLMRKMR